MVLLEGYNCSLPLRRRGRPPPKIAVQISAQATITKMVAQCTQKGLTIDQAMDWATDELEGFMRT